jgi:serine/threonine protein kinase
MREALRRCEQLLYLSYGITGKRKWDNNDDDDDDDNPKKRDRDDEKKTRFRNRKRDDDLEIVDKGQMGGDVFERNTRSTNPSLTINTILGRGQMGVVAIGTFDGKDAVVKFMPQSKDTEREQLITKMLGSPGPNQVGPEVFTFNREYTKCEQELERLKLKKEDIKGFAKNGTCCLLVLEKMDGTVQQWLTNKKRSKEEKRLVRAEIKELFRKLSVIHELSHGDVHSGNIMYKMDDLGKEVWRLIDFGWTYSNVANPTRFAAQAWQLQERDGAPSGAGVAGMYDSQLDTFLDCLFAENEDRVNMPECEPISWAC